MSGDASTKNTGRGSRSTKHRIDDGQTPLSRCGWVGKKNEHFTTRMRLSTLDPKWPRTQDLQEAPRPPGQVGQTHYKQMVGFAAPLRSPRRTGGADALQANGGLCSSMQFQPILGPPSTPGVLSDCEDHNFVVPPDNGAQKLRPGRGVGFGRKSYDKWAAARS